MPTRGSTPSITDVAIRAEVSRGTVSNVLNAPERVRPAVRDRVLAAIAELGYVRNESARSLAAGSSRVVGLVLADLGNSLFVDIARGAENTAAARGMRVMIADSAIDLRKQVESLELFREVRAAGVIVAPLDPVDEFLRTPALNSGLPVILTNLGSERWPGSSAVSDEHEGGRLAAQHLLDLGRRRLLFVGCHGDVTAVRERGRGAAEAVAGVARARFETIDVDGLEIPSGRAAAQLALDAGWHYDAVFAATDLMAVGVMQVLEESGRRVPDDVAVIGYDDNHFAAETSTPISSVAKNGRAMGAEAMRLLLDRLDDPSAAAERVVLHPELVARESTRGSQR